MHEIVKSDGGGKAVKGVVVIITDCIFARRNTDHAWTDVPPPATFTVPQSALRTAVP